MNDLAVMALFLLSLWCTNVHDGGDLEKLHVEMECVIEFLIQRRNS